MPDGIIFCLIPRRSRGIKQNNPKGGGVKLYNHFHKEKVCKLSNVQKSTKYNICQSENDNLWSCTLHYRPTIFAVLYRFVWDVNKHTQSLEIAKIRAGEL